jgi:hypothetical protein
MDVGSHTRGVRTSSRNVGSRNQHQQPRLPVKLELSSIDSHEDEEDDGEGDDDVIMSDEQDHHVLRSLHYNDDKARADQVKGYVVGDAQDNKVIPIGTTPKPARVSKVSVSCVKRFADLELTFVLLLRYQPPRQRRDSTVKRKEQSQSLIPALRLALAARYDTDLLVHRPRRPLSPPPSPCRHLH